VHGRIRPQSCGEQREVTLDCPSDCIYLQQAREHEKPRPVLLHYWSASIAELFRPRILFLYNEGLPACVLAGGA